MNIFKNIGKSFRRFYNWLLPVKKNTVFFASFSGSYSDNPKYISTKLHELYPEVKIIWVSSYKNIKHFPSYVETVLPNSKEFDRWLYRANVLIDHGSGFRYHYGSSCYIKRFILPVKKKRQYNFSTWHGTPLKTIGKDIVDSDNVYSYYYKHTLSSSDCILAGNQFTKDKIVGALYGKKSVPCKMYGTPRNDIFFNKSIDIKSVKEKLKLPLDKKIIIYAPTFRDNDINNSGISQMQQINFEQLFKSLSNRFGGDWVFVFRVHSVVSQEINTEELTRKHGCKFINGNIGDDMMEYLVCSDVLLTDYSSSMFDFALTKRPCFLYCQDLDNYKNNVRGFYFSIDKLPFPISSNSENLCDSIVNFDSEIYECKVNSFLKEIGNIEDGHASERVVQDIKYFMDTGVKNV